MYINSFKYVDRYLSVKIHIYDYIFCILTKSIK